MGSVVTRPGPGLAAGNRSQLPTKAAPGPQPHLGGPGTRACSGAGPGPGHPRGVGVGGHSAVADSCTYVHQQGSIRASWGPPAQTRSQAVSRGAQAALLSWPPDPLSLNCCSHTSEEGRLCVSQQVGCSQLNRMGQQTRLQGDEPPHTPHIPTRPGRRAGGPGWATGGQATVGRCEGVHPNPDPGRRRCTLPPRPPALGGSAHQPGPPGCAPTQ